MSSLSSGDFDCGVPSVIVRLSDKSFRRRVSANFVLTAFSLNSSCPAQMEPLHEQGQSDGHSTSEVFFCAHHLPPPPPLCHYLPDDFEKQVQHGNVTGKVH